MHNRSSGKFSFTDVRRLDIYVGLCFTIGLEHRHSNPPVGLNIQQRPTHLGLESTPPRKQSSVETKTDYGKYRYTFFRSIGMSRLNSRQTLCSFLNVVTGLIDQCFIFVVNPTKICTMLSKNLIRFVVKNETFTLSPNTTLLSKCLKIVLCHFHLLLHIVAHSIHLLFCLTFIYCFVSITLPSVC